MLYLKNTMDTNAQSSTVTTSMAGLPLPEEQQSSTQISALVDADLAEIFQCLPPFDRLLVSEVCRRWHDISRKAWLDVKHLDLSPIPGLNIGAVIKQCPNLQSVFAQEKCFAQKELYSLSRQPNLRSVQLYKCKCLVQERNGGVDDAFAAVFSENLRSAAWQELDFCDLQVVTERDASDETQVIFLLQSFPASILRLQLGSLQCAKGIHMPDPGISLARLQPHLECLIIATTKFEELHVNDGPDTDGDSFLSEPLTAYGRFLSLRELFVGWYSRMSWDDENCGYFTAYMPGLEVLFLYRNGTVIDEIVYLVTGHPRLRILVLADFSCDLGPDDDNTIPARRSYPNGHNAEPLPQLNVFVGRSASRELRFTPSAALRVFAISEPMPQFLEKEEIKPIFEGVWIAEKIKEAARRGEKFWRYEVDTVQPISNSKQNSLNNFLSFFSNYMKRADEAKPKSVVQSSAATSATQGKRVRFNDVPSFCDPAKIMASYPQTEGNSDVMKEESEDLDTTGSSTGKAKGNAQNGKAAKKSRSNKKAIDNEKILTIELDGSSEDASDEPGNKSQELGMSTEKVGCDCKKKCLPETCFCALNGIECQIETKIGCKCTASGCKNPGGRYEYNYRRIHNANRKTLELLEGDRGSLSKPPMWAFARMRID